MLLSELLSVPLPFVSVAVIDPSEVELLIEIGCAGGELDAVLSSCHALLGAATTVDAAAISVAHSCTGAVTLRRGGKGKWRKGGKGGGKGGATKGGMGGEGEGEGEGVEMPKKSKNPT